MGVKVVLHRAFPSLDYSWMEGEVADRPNLSKLSKQQMMIPSQTSLSPFNCKLNGKTSSHTRSRGNNRVTLTTQGCRLSPRMNPHPKIFRFPEWRISTLRAGLSSSL